MAELHHLSAHRTLALGQVKVIRTIPLHPSTSDVFLLGGLRRRPIMNRPKSRAVEVERQLITPHITSALCFFPPLAFLLDAPCAYIRSLVILNLADLLPAKPFPCRCAERQALSIRPRQV